jgi:hypothetical protein
LGSSRNLCAANRDLTERLFYRDRAPPSFYTAWASSRLMHRNNQRLSAIGMKRLLIFALSRS